MIQTSYFANWRNFPDGKRKISISRFTPKWFKEDHNALELAPSAELLLETKAGKVSDAEYEERYIRETLSKLDPQEIARKYKDSIFLCYESSEDFCHRQIVSAWLNENKVPVEEVRNIEHIYVSVENGFDDYDYFKKVMDRFSSNYKNLLFVADHQFAYEYAKDKGIQVDLFNEYYTAIVFTNTDDNIEFNEDVKKIYIVNGEEKRITTYNNK